MDSGAVIETLRAHEAELKAAGIVHLQVFGSVARGEATPESDVDLMAELDRSKRYSLLTFAGIEGRLADLLGVPVDLSSVAWMKEPVRVEAVRDAIFVF
jgi:predicted nucleotidyltransferase